MSELGDESSELDELEETGNSPTGIFRRVVLLLLRGLALIVVLGLLGWGVHRLGIDSLFDTGWIDQRVRGHGVAGGVLFVLVGTAFTAIGMPRQVLSFMAGYAFGLIIGTELALIATLAGAAIAFQYARFMGRAFVFRHFSRFIKKIDDFMMDRTLIVTIILRLSPFTNNLATNLAGGISGVRRLPFFAGSAIGYLPQTVIFTLLGSGVKLDPALRTSVSVVLFATATLAGAWLWYSYRRTLSNKG